jgi:hypothetical protein
VLGNADTEHRIKVPILRGIVGLSARTCQKLGPDTKALSAEEANDLRKQVTISNSPGFVSTPLGRESAAVIGTDLMTLRLLVDPARCYQVMTPKGSGHEKDSGGGMTVESC